MPGEKANEKPPIKRCDEHHPLSECVHDLSIEVRDLSDKTDLVRQEVRNHDNKTIKFYESQAKLSAQLESSNKLMEKIVELLNKETGRQAITSQHLEEVLSQLSKNMGVSKETIQTWLCEQLAESRKADEATATTLAKNNMKLIWKLVGAVVLLALFIAGVTGKINITWP